VFERAEIFIENKGNVLNKQGGQPVTTETSLRAHWKEGDGMYPPTKNNSSQAIQHAIELLLRSNMQGKPMFMQILDWKPKIKVV
jgi:hypothetical protein